MFQTTDPKDWLNRFAALQVVSATPRKDPLHVDGGASLLHMAITLYGGRRLDFKNTEDGAEHPKCRPVDLVPGNVYIGNLCSVGHQVMHEETRTIAGPKLTKISKLR